MNRRSMGIGTVIVILILAVSAWWFFKAPRADKKDAYIAELQNGVDKLTKELGETKEALAKKEAAECKDTPYTVKDGDSLSKIMKNDKDWKNGNLWPYLWAKNKDKIAKPDVIAIGLVIMIPCCICKTDAVPPIPPKKAVVPRVTQKVAPPAPAPVPAPTPRPAAEPATTPAPVPQAQTIIVPAPQVTITPPVNNIVVNVPPPAPAPAPVLVEPPAPRKEIIVPPPAPPPTVPEAKKPEPKVGEPKKDEKPKNKEGPKTSGSVTSLFGNLPTDRANLVNRSHFDIGVNLLKSKKFEIGPFVAIDGLNARKDTRVLDWDQKVSGIAGLRAIVPIQKRTLSGFVEATLSFMEEWRGSGHGLQFRDRGVGTASLSTRLEWQNPFVYAKPGSDGSGIYLFPGKFSGEIRKNVPFEKGNVLGFVRLEQGVTLAQKGKVSFVPQIYGQMGWDRDKKPWNNQLGYGGDFGIYFRAPHGTISVKPGYGCSKQTEGRVIGNSAGCGFMGQIGYDLFWGNKNPEPNSSLKK